MFLAVDESFASVHTVIGCLCLPVETLKNLEAVWLCNRLEMGVWGEIKWNKLCKSFSNKYQKFLGDYLNTEAVTFHSWAYKNPTSDEVRKYWDGDRSKVFYGQAYSLLRNVIRKCLNKGYDNNFYIVVDTTGARGAKEYTMTKDLLLKDKDITPRVVLDHCSQANSVVCGALQVADLCTGAVRYTYEKKAGDPGCSREFVEYLENINNKVPINFSPARLPDISQYKLHHCLFKH